MAINDSSLPAGIRSYLLSSQKTVFLKSANADISGIQSRTENPEISSTGKEVADMIPAIKQMFGVREDLIKAVQDSLAAGTYEIDPRKIAEKILQKMCVP